MPPGEGETASLQRFCRSGGAGIETGAGGGSGEPGVAPGAAQPADAAGGPSSRSTMTTSRQTPSSFACLA
jgi:hypothetical protein